MEFPLLAQNPTGTKIQAERVIVPRRQRFEEHLAPGRLFDVLLEVDGIEGLCAESDVNPASVPVREILCFADGRSNNAAGYLAASGLAAHARPRFQAEREGRYQVARAVCGVARVRAT